MQRPALSDLPPRFDVIIVGGGINGAGILREVARTNLRVLLLEKRDYASATSSASSKLIHGGLRYLKTGQWRLTLESVRERRRLLAEAPGLVDTQEFLMPIYRGTSPGKWTMRLGLWLYDLMAGQRSSRWVDADFTLKQEPHLRRENLQGAMQYQDASTDDARLVLRLLFESQQIGDDANVFMRNYTNVVSMLESGGNVAGVAVEDVETGETRELQAQLVIQAAGANTDARNGAPKLRPLRGSHLVFPQATLPVRRAVSWLHPADQRPIFAYPWLGATLYGTTDLDHDAEDPRPPRMSQVEADYLVEGLAHQFPELRLGVSDALSSFAGVRPVVAGGKDDPSAESRESAPWSKPGLVGMAGGKLTTFRVTAREVMELASRQLPALAPSVDQRLFNAAGASLETGRAWQRLGADADEYHEQMPAQEQNARAGHGARLADLRWSARHEHVVHLDDLLLRRTRLGLVEPRGAEAVLANLKPICQQELGWDDARWESECTRYTAIWARDHAPLNTAASV